MLFNHYHWNLKQSFWSLHLTGWMLFQQTCHLILYINCINIFIDQLIRTWTFWKLIHSITWKLYHICCHSVFIFVNNLKLFKTIVNVPCGSPLVCPLRFIKLCHNWHDCMNDRNAEVLMVNHPLESLVLFIINMIIALLKWKFSYI